MQVHQNKFFTNSKSYSTITDEQFIEIHLLFKNVNSMESFPHAPQHITVEIDPNTTLGKTIRHAESTSYDFTILSPEEKVDYHLEMASLQDEGIEDELYDKNNDVVKKRYRPSFFGFTYSEIMKEYYYNMDKNQMEFTFHRLYSPKAHKSNVIYYEVTPVETEFEKESRFSAYFDELFSN